jgi:hypothetical protein
MSKIKGKYVATVIIELEADESKKGLLPFERIKENFKGMTPIVKDILEYEISDDELGTVEVLEQFCDVWRCKDGDT